MSRQSEIKERWGYTMNQKVCSTCKHFKSEIIDVEGVFYDKMYKVEKNLRCGFGDFAVKKTATCAMWVEK